MFWFTETVAGHFKGNQPQSTETHMAVNLTHTHTTDPWLKVGHKQTARCSDPDLPQLMVSTLWGPVYNPDWQKASLLLMRQLSIFFTAHHLFPHSLFCYCSRAPHTHTHTDGRCINIREAWLCSRQQQIVQFVQGSLQVWQRGGVWVWRCVYEWKSHS